MTKNKNGSPTKKDYMSERKPTRLNMVLKEFNISLDRAVDYLKEKGIEVESNPNTRIEGKVYDVLFDEFASDKDRKEASIEVGEEKRKEKEALKLEREKEEQKRLDDEAKRAEVIKARATLSGPKHVGSIDLNPKKTKEEPKKEEPAIKEESKVETPIAAEKAVEAPKQEEVKQEPKAEQPKAIVEKPKVVSEKPVTPKETKVEKPKAEKKTEKKEETPTEPTAPAEETLKTQYQKLSGTTFTGKVIDLTQFEAKPKKVEPRATTPRA